MELIITKNGHVYARATDAEAAGSDVYALQQVQDVPEYPEAAAGRGKAWELDYVDGVLQWVAIDRPLTQEERLDLLERTAQKVEKQWRTGELVIGDDDVLRDPNVGPADERYYNGRWYHCKMGHTTQENWNPERATTMWELLEDA